ncbi:MAG: hypothetical protein ACK56F_05155 [bacterium]
MLSAPATQPKSAHSAPLARNRARNSELALCAPRAVCLTTLPPTAKSASGLQT